MRRLLLLALCFAPPVLAQPGIAPSVTTDKAAYDYGETILVRYTLTNEGTEPFTVWAASSGCQAYLSFDGQSEVNGFFLGQFCTADSFPYEFAPGASKTWGWRLDPSELGVPEADGTHTIAVYFADDNIDGGPSLTEATRALTTITAPQYLGGRIDVVLAGGVTEDDVQDVAEALNAKLVGQDPTVPPPDGMLWEIEGTTLSDAVSLYGGDPRFLRFEPFRYLAYADIFFTGGENDAQPGSNAALTTAHPNPFTTSTSFALTVPEAGSALVEVFDVLGRRVATLHDGPLAPGVEHRFTFTASDLPSGLYIVRATGDGYSQTRRVTLGR